MSPIKKQTKIGFFGSGLMGEPMIRRLLDAGYDLIVYNRTIEKAQHLVRAGADIQRSPAAVAEGSSLWITMLTDHQALSDTLFTKQQVYSGKTCLQMGTIAPDESKSLCHVMKAGGGEYLEAPVLGSIPQVKTGSLLILVGGPTALYRRLRPLLNRLGRKHHLAGPVGQAAALKLAMNHLIASLTSAFAMSLGYIKRKGVDTETFMSVLRESALYAPTFDKKLARMLSRDFGRPNFPVRHLLKDMKLAEREFRSFGIAPPMLTGMIQILQDAIALGHGDSDYSALYNAVDPE